ADISIPFLSQIEQGNKWPHPDSLAQIARALNVEVYELFRAENEMLNDVRSVISALTEKLVSMVDDTSEYLKKNYLDEGAASTQIDE
ncbi:MAG: helix-turn-helix domain-containing protein, partial [Treponema sp.]|nr:helix-turn-helix domain-containing protein [Treponema sp.]